ncbi:MAG: ATP-binding protein [Deltaproteobacteria bacterium]|nr:ATP-binding protein [Deltaproteobacteria bacterium]
MLCSLLTSGHDPESLEQHLCAVAEKQVGRKVSGTELRRQLLAAGVELRPEIDRRNVALRLQELRDDFADAVRGAAAVLALETIPQEEIERVVLACEEAAPASTIVVHGPPGCGKSNILAQALTRIRVPILAIRADRDDPALLGGGTNPVAAFRAFCGNGPGLVLIDQLDQLRIGGSQVQARMERIRAWIRNALGCDLSVLVGCRSVDAQRDTQLAHLLSPGEDLRGPARHAVSRSNPGAAVPSTHFIRVEELGDAVVVSALASRGIAAADLGPRLRRLLARPLALALFLSLREEIAEASACANIIKLMDLWWAHVRSPWDAQAEDVLERLCAFMEERGELSCPESVLLHADVVASLTGAGVLQRDTARKGHLRPFHQVLTDTRIAIKWGGHATAETLCTGLGGFAAQGIVQARRLRLAVPLLVERPEVVHELFEGSRLRPLMKRALLVGLSDLEDPTAEIVDVVKKWSADPALAPVIFEWVAHGHARWVALLRDEIDEAWEHDPDLRAALLRLLVSVDDGAPGEVDVHLARWSAADPHVLVQAGPCFRADPGSDSDARFEKRLRFEAHARLSYRDVDWDALMTTHPDRAARLFAWRLRSCPLPLLRDGDPSWQSGLPTRAAPSVGDPSLGVSLWRELAQWWTQFGGIELYEIRVGDSDEEDAGEAGVLVGCVEVVASALAVSVARGTIVWEELLPQLPGPLRDLDGWLLLCVAAHLPEDTACSVADLIAAWFMADPRWANLETGHRWRSYDLRLPGRALERLGGTVSDQAFRRLTEFLIDFPDEWTVEDEQSRGLRANRRGRTALALLPHLPEDRLSERAKRVLNEFRRKFGERENDQRDAGICSGWVHSTFPDEVVDGWRPEQWIERLLTAPQEGRIRFTPGEIREYSVSSLSRQLQDRAQRRPQRYLAVARAFDDAVPAEARAAILSALGNTRPPDGLAVAEAEWEPLEHAEVAELLQRDAFLGEPRCARNIGWTVLARAEHGWSDAVLERLKAIATREAGAHDRAMWDERHPDGYASYRLNDDACVAIEALAAVARRHAERRPDLLEAAAALADHQDVGRRASSALLAMACESAAPDRAHEILLAACSNASVAAELDVARALFHVATSTDASEDCRAGACTRLLALAEDTRRRVLLLAGDAAFALRTNAAIDEQRFEETLGSNFVVRQGVARTLSRRLHDPGLEPQQRDWTQALALRFADEGGPAGDEIANAFLLDPIDHLLEDVSFMQRLLKTKSVRDSIEPIVAACDRRNHLIPVKDQVLEMAQGVARGELPWETSGTTWESAGSVAALVSRLVEEAEATGQNSIREKALDAWDLLLVQRGGREMRTGLTELLAE